MIDWKRVPMKEHAERLPKDRDFLRTREGMFFCVTGYLHPPDRYTGYLKYSPASKGKWEDDVTAYRRELPYYHVRNVAKTIRFLEEHYPAYVHDCHVRDLRFSMVPEERVVRYYAPEMRMQQILDAPQDPLEEQVRALAKDVMRVADIDRAKLGITGSVLIGLHNPRFSDIDLTVYGLTNAQRLRATLRERGIRSARPLDDAYVAKWTKGIAGRFPLTVKQAEHIAARRWNYGTYEGRYFSVHPIRSDDEITERYGDHTYRGEGTALIRATVEDVGEALYMPAIYRVQDVHVLDGESAAAAVQEVVSHEGLYRDIADVGTVVEAKGKLESVDGQPRHLVIGSTELAGRGYIVPVRSG